MGEEKSLVKSDVALETAHMREQREHYKWLLGLAKGFFESGMCPEGIKSAAQAAQIMLIGEAYGIHPAIALQQIGSFKGRVVMSAAMMVGIIRRDKLGTFSYKEDDGWCEVTGTRTDTGETYTAPWDRERVTRSGINMGEKGLKFAWKSFEREMLRHKGEAEVCRALFQDRLMGVYTPEELPEEKMALVEAPTKSRTAAIKEALGLPAPEEPQTSETLQEELHRVVGPRENPPEVAEALLKPRRGRPKKTKQDELDLGTTVPELGTPNPQPIRNAAPENPFADPLDEEIPE